MVTSLSTQELVRRLYSAKPHCLPSTPAERVGSLARPQFGHLRSSRDSSAVSPIPLSNRHCEISWSPRVDAVPADGESRPDATIDSNACTTTDLSDRTPEPSCLPLGPTVNRLVRSHRLCIERHRCGGR